MARIRTVKPSFFTSLSNADLPISTRLTFIGLWTYADDQGRGVDDARLIKAAVWPLDEPYTTKKVTTDMDLLEKAGKIRRYVVDDRRFFAIVQWTHQRIDKPQKSILPAPPGEDDSRNDPGTIPPNNGTAPGTAPPKAGGEVEGKGSGREVEGKGTPNLSSSIHHRVAPASADDDDGAKIPEPPPPIDERSIAWDDAVAMIVDRRIATSTTPIANPRAYRAKVTADVRSACDARIVDALDEGLSPAEVCDRLEPKAERPMPAAPPPSPHRDWQPPAPSDDQVTDPESAKAALRELRRASA